MFFQYLFIFVATCFCNVFWCICVSMLAPCLVHFPNHGQHILPSLLCIHGLGIVVKHPVSIFIIGQIVLLSARVPFHNLSSCAGWLAPPRSPTVLDQTLGQRSNERDWLEIERSARFSARGVLVYLYIYSIFSYLDKFDLVVKRPRLYIVACEGRWRELRGFNTCSGFT